MPDLSTTFAGLAALSLLAWTLFLSLSSRQKSNAHEAEGPNYKLYSWLALIVALFFVFMAFATFEIQVIQ
ncbi:MAG: hypothetical protein AAGK17_07190 [Pseudomonadota bacterium]